MEWERKSQKFILPSCHVKTTIKKSISYNWVLPLVDGAWGLAGGNMCLFFLFDVQLYLSCNYVTMFLKRKSIKTVYLFGCPVPVEMETWTCRCCANMCKPEKYSGWEQQLELTEADSRLLSLSTLSETIILRSKNKKWKVN